MAYNGEKLTRLKSLKELAQRIEAGFATKKSVEDLQEQVAGLEAAGGEPNVITAVKVNGEALSVDGKEVDITVPTKVSDIANDSKFQTETEVAAAVAAADHLKRRIVSGVDAIDKTAAGAAQYIYMVLKSSTKAGDKYDEYMVIDGEVERVGDWTVDLSGYQPKEEGMGLSANSFTDEEKAKLEGLEIASDAEVQEMLDEVFGAADAA